MKQLASNAAIPQSYYSCNHTAPKGEQSHYMEVYSIKASH